MAHEALIREWPTLRGWLAENREGLRLHHHLTEAAQEWQQMSRDKDSAYRGARLAQALEWAAANPAELNASEREFLQASKTLAEGEEAEREAQRQRELEAARKLAEAEKRRAEEQSRSATQLRRRALYLTGAFILALAMAVAALFFGEQARQSAVTAQSEQRIAFSRELAAAAISNLEVDPDRSILLALEAVSVAQSAGLPVPLEAEDALHQAVQASRVELVLRGQQDAVWDVAFSPDGAHIATTSRDRSVRIWDAATGKETLALRGHTGIVLSVAYSLDGSRLVTASDDRTAIVWDTATGDKLMTLSSHTGSVGSAVFSEDERWLATASDDRTAKIWDAATGEELLTLTGHAGGVLAVAFSPDDSRLATAGADRTAQIWDTASGEEILVMRGHTAEVVGVAFSPDGTRLATAGSDRAARVWDSETGRELLTLVGHGDWVFDIAFSPDGTRLATASLDGTVKIWDAATGRELMRLLGNLGNVHSVAFTPADGGASLVIGGGDGISLYLLRIEDLIALAQSRLTRSLTPDECRRYLHGDEAVCDSLAGADIASLQPSASEGRVCHVPEVGGQGSLFNQLQYNGARSVAERFGWEVIFLEALDPADYDQLLATSLASDCDLIMTSLFAMSDSTKAAAEANPGQRFYISDVAYEPPLDNVWTSVYATDQAAFLAGYVAASVTKSGRIGTFGGIDIPPVTDFMDGFALGAAYYNAKHEANVEVLGWDAATREGAFTGNFFNEDDGRLLAEQLMNDGADVIMPVAGPVVGWGAAVAAQEREGVYFVGVDVDWTLLAPEFSEIVLTSVEKRYDASAAQAVIDGTFSGGAHIGTLENGGVGISPFHDLDSLVSPQVKAELEQITADIIAGKIKTKP